MEKGFRTVAAAVFAAVFPFRAAPGLCGAAPSDPLVERFQEFFTAHSVQYGAIACDPALSVLTIKGLSWREPEKQRLFRLNSLVLSDIDSALVDAVTGKDFRADE